MTIWVGGLVAATAILATWLVAGVVLAGLGLLAIRALRLHGPLDVEVGPPAFWLGFCLCLMFLQIWHLVLPVGAPALGLLAGAGLAGWAVWRREALVRLRSVRWRRAAPLLIIVVALGGWAGLQSLGSPRQYDTGMYHLPLVQWFERHAIVPGLGNLHGRLAFNNSSLLYAALLDVGPWEGRTTHLANGLLVFALLAHSALAGWRLLGHSSASGTPEAPGPARAAAAASEPAGARPRPARPSDDTPWHALVFDLVLFAPGILLMTHEDAWSLSPDVTATVVLLVAASLVYRMLTAKAGDDVRAARRFVIASTLLVGAFTIKLSAAVFVAATLPLVWGRWIAAAFRRAGATGPRFRRSTIAALALGALLVLPWLVRGAIFSGYPLYPTRVLAAPVDWRVPAEQADAEMAWTVLHGRGPEAEGRWVVPWLETMVNPYRLPRVVSPLAVAILAAGTWLALGKRRRRREDGDGGWLLVPPALAGLVAWFLTSPHPRFAMFLFWTLAVTAVAQAARRWDRRDGVAAWSLIAFTLVLASVPVADRMVRAALSGGSPLWAASDVLLSRPGSDGGLRPVPEAELEGYTTRSGLRVSVPVEDNHCWAAPPPCTPHPAPNIELRRADDPARGFRVVGDWSPLRWPNLWDDFLERWRAEREDARAGADP